MKCARYFYRADGMRIKKIDGLTINWVIDDEQTGSGHYDEITDVNMPTYRYYYDGQMCMEEDKTWGISQPPHGSNVEVTQYGIGARGIDYIYKKFKQSGSSTWNTTAEQFPLYDGHGNMVATLSRDGSDFTVKNRRVYDVWGGVRNETSLDNAPNTKYCANLGHKEDDESGLIYMRARYYEPWTGRFVSEDPALDGSNWYIYCYNQPVNLVDFSGKEPFPWWELGMALAAAIGLVIGNYAAKNLFVHKLMEYRASWQANGKDNLDEALAIHESLAYNVFGAGLAAIFSTAMAWFIGLIPTGKVPFSQGGRVALTFFVSVISSFIVTSWLEMIAHMANFDWRWD